MGQAGHSPLGGRLHLLVRLVSHDVVHDLEAALGPGTGTQLRGEKVTP